MDGYPSLLLNFASNVATKVVNKENLENKNKLVFRYTCQP